VGETRIRPGGWLLAEGARHTRERFREGWREHATDIPRRRFFWTITWGWAIASAVMLALCWGARRLEDAGRLAWEFAVLERVGTEGPMSFSTALWAESPGNSVFMIPVILAVALLCVWVRRPLRAMAVLASFFIMDLVVLLGWLVWNRDRPVAIEGGIASPGFHSFPSGHVAQMVAAYGLFTWFWVRASRNWIERVVAVTLHVVATTVVALSRLRLGAHWPTDIIAGAIVGVLWLAVVIVALRRAESAGGR
jgi:membrane-associated phospholipid phosphatase